MILKKRRKKPFLKIALNQRGGGYLRRGGDLKRIGRYNQFQDGIQKYIKYSHQKGVRRNTLGIIIKI